MDQKPLVHDVPFPNFLRIIMCALGAVPLVMGPYELWRGVWPPNVTSPFFGFLLIAALAGAAVMIRVGFFTPDAKLIFAPNELVVEERFPFRQRTSKFGAADIVSIAPLRIETDDGETWPVEIKLKSGRKFLSRRFDTQVTAQKHAAEFKGALGI